MAATVDEYLDALPAEVRGSLESLRQVIRAAAPMADEVISYRIPTYKHHGPLVHFAAFKDHCSFITASGEVIGRFRDELKGYKISGTTIQFEHDRPLASDLVARIVKFRVKQNEDGT